MNNLLIKKFYEYHSRINILLNAMSLDPNNVFLTDQLLDRLERINRKTFALNHLADDPMQYCIKLKKIISVTNEAYEIVKEYLFTSEHDNEEAEELVELFFLMNDLFYQSEALLESVYENH
jgi:hypothetical protein